MYEKVKSSILDNQESLIGLFEYIHNNPEIAYEEFKSSKAIVSLLESHDFEVEEGIGGLNTAFKARFKGRGKGPRVAFLAEYDALPGIGHGCGHNVIATCSTGAAIGLSKVIKELDGEVLVIGTPAEEGGGGKIYLLEANEFADVDYALMIHPTTDRSIIGRGGLAATGLTLEFFGKSAHSATPEEGINALTAVIEVFNGINAIRSTLAPKTNINGIIVEGGKAANVITDYAKASFSVRAATVKELEETIDRVKNVINATEVLIGAKAKVSVAKLYAERYPNMIIAERFKYHMENQGIEMGYPDPKKRFGSSDIGNVTLKIPAIHSYLKIGNQEVKAHSKEYAVAAKSDLAKDMAIKGAVGLALAGLDILMNEELRIEIKNEFDQKVPK